MLVSVLNRFRHWLSRPGRHRRRSKTVRAVGTLSSLEILEGRVLLDAVRWINLAGGAWEVAANWDAGRTPGPADDAIIDLQGVAVTHASGADSVHSLQLTGSALTLAGGMLGIATDVRGNGPLTLSGGTLAGATVAAGLTFRNGGFSALDHVTIDTDLEFTGRSAGLRVVNGLTVNGTLFLAGNAGTTSGTIDFRNTQTVRGHGRIDLGTGRTALMDIDGGSTVTLGRNLTITGRDAWINAFGSDGNQLINKGTIVAEGPGGTFIIDNCINQGTILAQGGTMDLENLTNTGTVTATGGSLELVGWTNYGVVSVSGTAAVTLGTGTNAGGTLYASDRATIQLGDDTVVTNTDSTLTLMGSSVLDVSTSGGLSGGTVTGSGTVDFKSGTLDAVTLDADMEVNGYPSGFDIIQNGLTLNGTLHLSGDFGFTAYLTFAGTQRIDGTGSIVFEGYNGGLIFLEGDNSVLTLGPGLTVHGETGVIQGGFGVANTRFVNEGTIVADVPGPGLVLTNFTNLGTISTGSNRITLNGTWSNSGLLNVGSGGTLTLVDGMANPLGGTLSTAAGSTVVFDGRFIDTGQILNLSGPGTYRLTGTMVGGTVTGAPLQAMDGATLDGLTLDDDLATMGGAVTITDGLTLNGTATFAGGFSFATTQMVDGSGSIVMNSGGLSLDAPNITVTLGPQLTISGGLGGLGASQMGSHFVNEGTIASDVSRYSMGIYDCTNQGTIQASNSGNLRLDSTFVNVGGTVVLGANSHLIGDYTQTSGVTILDNSEIDPNSTVDIQGGTLMGTGLIVGNVRNAGMIAVGSPGVAGRLTIRGDYTQTTAGTLRLEVGGANPGVDFDQLVVTGQASLGGMLAVALINGFMPAHGDTFQVLTAGSLQGMFTTLDLDPVFQDPHYAATGVTLAAR